LWFVSWLARQSCAAGGYRLFISARVAGKGIQQNTIHPNKLLSLAARPCFLPDKLAGQSTKKLFPGL